MKKAIWLAGLFLCTATGFAADAQTNLADAGKKRNEEAMERSLEQTGWKNDQSSQDQKPTTDSSRERTTQISQPKSS